MLRICSKFHYALLLGSCLFITKTNALAQNSKDQLQSPEFRQAVRQEVQRILKENSQTPAETTEEVSAPVVQEKAPEQQAKKKPLDFNLEWEGYGDIRYSYYDYDEDINQPEGSRAGSNTSFDLTRFVLKIEGEHEPSELGFEAEIEFEHGGTGSALELEFEEFGEFESEIEKGGEVILEELYLRKKFDNGIKVKAGRFYVGVGLLSHYYTPLDYLGTSRPEAETAVIPGVWDEIGVSAEKSFDWAKLTLQVVNGLDSSGFSSARWVATGHQERFEVNRAENLAYVARVDLTPWGKDFLFGGATYWAPSTSDNRPREDLEVDGQLFIVSGHTDLSYNNWRAKGFVMLGDLEDAAEISNRNSRLSNNLLVDRTPVAEQALSGWAELGYDIIPLLSEADDAHRVEPFVRLDYVDSMSETSPSVFDNPRYERMIYTTGLAYTYRDAVTAKLDWSLREFEASDVDSQNTVRVALGFIY